MPEIDRYVPLPQIRSQDYASTLEQNRVRFALEFPPYLDTERIGVSIKALVELRQRRGYPSFELANKRSERFKHTWGGIYLEVEQIEAEIARDRSVRNGLRRPDVWVSRLNREVFTSQVFGPDRLMLTYEPRKAIGVWSLLFVNPVFAKIS